MTPKQRLYAAGAGTVGVAICCFTPLLAITLVAVGLGAFSADGRRAAAPVNRARGYLQSGQQPVPATFVAAAAVVATSARSAVASPSVFVFIVHHLLGWRSGPSATQSSVEHQADLKVKRKLKLKLKRLDLQVEFRVFNSKRS
jgi:hypothetical protein